MSANCYSVKSCGSCSSVLEKIRQLLCLFFDKVVARFITGVINYRNIDVNNVGVVIASYPVRIEDYAVFNTTNVKLYLKLYDKGDTIPTFADTPYRTLLVPPESGANLADLNLHLSTGLSIRATTGVTDADDTAPAANGLVLNLGYKKL